VFEPLLGTTFTQNKSPGLAKKSPTSRQGSERTTLRRPHCIVQTSPLLPPQLPEGRPMAPDGVSCGLLIGLASFELGFQFRPEGAVGPLHVAQAAIEEHPLADLVAPALG
jgi:hypothetical protein